MLKLTRLQWLLGILIHRKLGEVLHLKEYCMLRVFVRNLYFNFEFEVVPYQDDVLNSTF